MSGLRKIYVSGTVPLTSRKQGVRTVKYKSNYNPTKKKNAVAFPRREIVLVVEALRQLRLRSWLNVHIENPLHTNRAGEVVGGDQWLDFVVQYAKGRLLVILFWPKWAGNARPHKYQKNWHKEKQDFLDAKGIPHLTILRTETSQDYQVRILMKIRALRREMATEGEGTPQNPLTHLL